RGTRRDGGWSLPHLLLGGCGGPVALRQPRAALIRFGPAGIAIGIFSFTYHASYTFALQFFDFVAMFLFCFTVLARNAVRLRWIAPARETRFFVAGVALLSASVPPLFALGFPIQALVALCIPVGLGQEWQLRPPDRPKPAF